MQGHEEPMGPHHTYTAHRLVPRRLTSQRLLLPPPPQQPSSLSWTLISCCPHTRQHSEETWERTSCKCLRQAWAPLKVFWGPG